MRALRSATAAAAAALATMLAGAPARAGDLAVRDAVSPEAPPGVRVHAAYFVLENAGEEPRRLVRAEAAGYAATEIHETREANGVMSMAPVAELEIPAGGTVSFVPGGLHVMLMGPEGDRAVGDSVPLVLIFADGTRLATEAEVVDRATMMKQGGGQGMDHGQDHGHGASHGSGS